MTKIPKIQTVILLNGNTATLMSDLKVNIVEIGTCYIFAAALRLHSPSHIRMNTRIDTSIIHYLFVVVRTLNRLSDADVLYTVHI